MSMKRAAPRARAGRRLALALAAAALLPGCFTFRDTVGAGPHQPPLSVEEHKRWFALYGLLPLNDEDLSKYATTGRGYRITTEFTPIDVLITAFTSLGTFYVQTVTVED